MKKLFVEVEMKGKEESREHLVNPGGEEKGRRGGVRRGGLEKDERMK